MRIKVAAGFALLIALLSFIGGAFVEAQLPSTLMYGQFNGVLKPLAVDTNGNLNVTANLSGADGAIVDAAGTIKATVFSLTNSHPLAAQIVDGSGTAITSFGGGTQFAEDTASANADVGTLAMARRTATPANTSGTDGDYETLQMAAGRLWVDASGVTLTVASHAVTNAGTFVVQENGAALTALQLIDNIPNTIGSTTSGQSGVLSLAATTTAAPTYTTAQSNPLSLQTDGSLRAAITNTLTVSSHAVTNAGTFVVQENGAALTALQLIDNLPNTLGSTTSGQSGVLSLGAVTTAAPTYTNAQSNAFSLQTDGSLRVAITNGGGGGTSAVDDADFTDSSSSFTLVGCVAEIASPSSVTEGDMGACAMTLNRSMKVTLYDTSGNALTPSADQTEDAAEANGATGPLSLFVRRDAAASSSGTSGDYSTGNVDALGLLWTRQLNPCTGVAHTTVPISVAADTAVISASASNRNYICGGTLIAAAAEVVSIWEGTGSACGTSSAAIAGSTTEANGMSLAANGGFVIAQPIRGLSTNVDTCIRVVGSSRIAGWLEVVQAP